MSSRYGYIVGMFVLWLLSGCELVTEFDRSKITAADAGEAADATTDASP